jgi:hypothetical protein
MMSNQSSLTAAMILALQGSMDHEVRVDRGNADTET